MRKKIICRFLLRLGLAILLANLLAGWIIARRTLAAEFDIIVIADLNTAIPGGSGNAGNFTDFGLGPSLDGENVAFWGRGLIQRGIYTGNA